MTDIYFWRQVLILCGTLPYSYCFGFMMAFPAILSPAITSSNSTDIRTTADHASWITAINGIGGMLGSFIITAIMQILGRKVCMHSFYACFLIGWSIIPLAKNITALYIARFIQGINVGGIYIISIIISEYVHPSRRGYFIALVKVTNAIGVLCCHTLSTFWTWKQIAISVAIISLVACVLVFFWPESPSHLALKGRFNECEKSFTWLNGNSEESQKHLKAMVEAQREKNSKNIKGCYSFVDSMKNFFTKDFQKVFLMSSLLTLSINVCGRYFFIASVIQIMMELLDNKNSALYFTLGADLLMLIAVSLSVMVMKSVKRRTILFCSGAIAGILMLIFSILVYLKTVYTFPAFALWLTAVIIILQCFVINIGLNPVIFTLVGEVFPLEHKGLGAFVSCFVFTFLYSLILKITPVMMDKIEIYGTFAVYGVILLICMALLYESVPETKDKTLQEIEDEMSVCQSKEIIIMK